MRARFAGRTRHHFRQQQAAAEHQNGGALAGQFHGSHCRARRFFRPQGLGCRYAQDLQYRRLGKIFQPTRPVGLAHDFGRVIVLLCSPGTRQHDDVRAGAMRRVDSGQRVAEARTARHGGHPDAAGGAGISVGHRDRLVLVPSSAVGNAARDGRHHQRCGVLAHHAEDDFDSGLRQDVGHSIVSKKGLEGVLQIHLGSVVSYTLSQRNVIS